MMQSTAFLSQLEGIVIHAFAQIILFPKTLIIPYI